MASRATTFVEGAGGVKSVSELLEDARAITFTDTAAARAMAQRARVLARTLDDRTGEAEALYRLASIAHSAGQPDDAFALALDAREVARRASAVFVEAWSLQLVGLVHFEAGNFTEALSSLLQALELTRCSDPPTDGADEASILNAVAVIHHALGDTDRALATYEAALTVNKGSERPDTDASALVNMAEIRAARGEDLLAVGLCESALRLCREHVPVLVPYVLAQLGLSYCALDLLDRAAECLDEADEVVAERSEGGIARSSDALAVAMARGRLDVVSGTLDRAIEDYRSALSMATLTSNTQGQLQAHAELASVFKQLGNFEEALAHQEERFKIHEGLFSQGTDLRIKTLQIAHDTEAARQQAEILRLRTGELEAMVRGRTYDLEEYQLEAFQRLAILAEFRDTDTGEHTVRVGDLSAEIAAELDEPDEWVKHLRHAGRLHDIGKVAVPDAILLKPGPLTPAEFDVMKTHTTIGAEILSGSSSPLIQLAAEVALNHHERWDGSGYPNGLSGHDIPLSGRIVTVADVFDALTSHRTYKHAWTDAEAVQYIQSASGTQFEPTVVDAFVRVMIRRDPSLSGQVSLVV